jgi:adenylate kinase family enzyme
MTVMASPARIAILGNAGTGKSRLAADLAHAAGLPVIHLDRLLWTSDWTIVREECFLRDHERTIAADQWVIDGIGYPSAIESRLQAADTIILLRYPLWRCCWWALKRRLGARAEGRPLGSTEAPLRRLLPAMLRLERDLMPDLMRRVQSFAGSKRLYVLRSPRELPKLRRELV